MNALTPALMAATILSSPALPDGVLIEACERHPALTAAYNARLEVDKTAWDDTGPEAKAYLANRAIISEARPRTLAGIVAKARAAKLDAIGPDGEEHDQAFTQDAGEWAWDLVNDLLDMDFAGYAQARRRASEGTPGHYLTTLADLHIANRQAMDAPGVPDECSVVDEYFRTYELIEDSRPVDMEGFVAVARVALEEMHVNLDGTLEDLPSVGDQLARGLVQHLIQHGGLGFTVASGPTLTDQPLLAAEAAYRAIEDKIDELYKTEGSARTARAKAKWQAKLDAALAEQEPFMEPIARARSVTIEGMRAKARTLRGMLGSIDHDAGNGFDVNLINSLLRDLLDGEER